MIITRTPIRISFLGGGTDYPDYFLQHGGQTLGVAIDKYSYVTVNQLADLFDYSIHVSYSRSERVSSLDEIVHPSVRECLRKTEIYGGVEIHYMGDLPARTGLGSSSSFTVGLLHALHAFKGSFVANGALAAEAVHVEQNMIKERVGVQDQYTCAHGGLLKLKFNQENVVKVHPLPLTKNRMDQLNGHLMLFYTRIRRHAHEILDEQLKKTVNGKITEDLSYLNDLVDQGLDILVNNHPISQFGELLDNAWEIKKRLSGKITNSEIDQYYSTARKAGAIGGKLLGAGGGGFLLLFVSPDKQDAVSSALKGLSSVSFSFDHSGSTLFFYQPC